MKCQSSIYLFLALLTSQVFFSCTSAKLAAVQNNPDIRTRLEKSVADEDGAGSMAQTRTAASLFDNADADVEEILEASAANDANLPPAETALGRRTEKAVPAVKTSVAPAAKPKAREIIAAVKEQAKLHKETRKEFKQQYTKAERREMRRSIKARMQDSNTQILAIVLAILLPPIGVLVYEGELTTRFWIALILTLLFFLPGMIYALLVVTGTI